MPFTVGIDSYVTVAEANGYVEELYLVNDAAREEWAQRSQLDKEVLLRRATEAIERLPFSGKKAALTQTLSFPRYPSSAVPDGIKRAQVEEAVALSNPVYAEAMEETNELRARGVFKYRIGKLSEQFGKGTPLPVCPRAYNLLWRYMSGGYDIW